MKGLKMPEKVYNRIVIPNLTINRQGTAYGDALNYDYTEALEGLEKGSEEYHKAAARNIILHGPWTVEINQWNSMGLSLYLQALFAQSCSEIIITSPDRKTFDLSVRGLPDIAKKRIKYAKAESGNVYELVKSFFLPIAKDLSQRGAL
jgi:hypothetical protein